MKLMRAGAAIAALTFASLSASPALADDGVLQAQPASQWHVALEDGLCHLVRTFTVGGAEIQFILRRRAPYHPFELNVVSDDIPHRKRSPVTQYDIAAEPIQHEVSYHLKDGEWEGFSVNLRGDYFASPVEQSLVITDAFASDFALPMANLGSALTVMDQCLDEVVRSWGLDPAQHRSLTKMAEPDGDVSELIIEALGRTQEALNVASGFCTKRVVLGQPDRVPFKQMIGSDDLGREDPWHVKQPFLDVAQQRPVFARRRVDADPETSTRGRSASAAIVLAQAKRARSQTPAGQGEKRFR